MCVPPAAYHVFYTTSCMAPTLSNSECPFVRSVVGQNLVDRAQLSGDCASRFQGGQNQTSIPNNAEVLVHVGGDSRRCPVIQEEENEEEESGGLNNLREPTTPSSPRRPHKKRASKQADEENMEGQRAQVAKEWATIEQVRRGSLLLPLSSSKSTLVWYVLLDKPTTLFCVNMSGSNYAKTRILCFLHLNNSVQTYVPHKYH